MRVIVAGSRGVSEQDAYDRYLKVVEKNKLAPSRLITGGCPRGPDKVPLLLCQRGLFARDCVDVYPARWDKYGRSAGPIRNGQMAEVADALILIWDGSSPGSMNMKAHMVQMGKLVYEVIIR